MRFKLLFFILLYNVSAFAQRPDLGGTEWVVTPGISVGYTLGAYVTFGAELNTGYNLGYKNQTLNVLGGSLQYNVVLDYYAFHHIVTPVLMYRSKDIDIRTGFGMSFIKHGRLCDFAGIYLEASYHIQPLAPVSTWVGARIFYMGYTRFYDYDSYSSVFARYQLE
jgi:hypothetical protein